MSELSELNRRMHDFMIQSHERHQHVIDRLHGLELAVSTRMTEQATVIRSEFATADAKLQAQIDELRLETTRVHASRYRTIVATMLSVGAAAATMVLEFGFKKLW